MVIPAIIKRDVRFFVDMCTSLPTFQHHPHTYRDRVDPLSSAIAAKGAAGPGLNEIA